MPIAASISINALWPEILLAAAGCGVLLLALIRKASLSRLVPGVTLVAILAAFAVLKFGGVSSGVGSGLVFDRTAEFVRIAALVLGLLVTLVAWSQPVANECAEFFAMMLFAICGLMLTGASCNLVILFLALELVSIPTYALVALSRLNARALEGGTKYFYLGAMSAAIMAYGFCFLYGAAGSATLDQQAVMNIAAKLNGIHAAQPDWFGYGIAALGLVLSIGGLLFKLAAVPFHFYVADVYQGAASPVAGLLGFVPKLAGFVALFRLMQATGWRIDGGGIFWLLWIIAALSMTIGNVLALRQSNIKRMLAYSGVAHSGYMLVALLAGPGIGAGIMGDGPSAIFYYILIYGIANLCAFAVLGLLHVRGMPCETLRDVAGLVRKHPEPALLLALAMLTLMGLPPTAGFWGKASLFGSALFAANQNNSMHTWLIALVLIGAINSAVAAAYYLRVTAAALLYEADETAEPLPREMQHWGAALCGFLLLIYAFFPNWLMQAGQTAADNLRGPLVPPAQTSAAPPPAAEHASPDAAPAISKR